MAEKKKVSPGTEPEKAKSEKKDTEQEATQVGRVTRKTRSVRGG